jgi:diguanylate cyclase (GGDEF)-like protein
VLMINRAATLEKAGKFEQLAITDPLTGLYNRRFLEDRLQEEFSRSERQQQNFCIILADLDNFKIYNDMCGHLAGDNALRKTSDLMRRSARDMDIVTRYGGEEFCLILPGTRKKESVFVGERIRRAIEAESFPGESHLPLGRLTTSIGIATFPADGVTANELIHAADLALYQAKALGRNRLVLYEASLEDQVLLSN